MSALLSSPGLEACLAQLGAGARGSLEAAAREALRLHAEEAALPHLLCAILADADCAAHRALVHGFADPATLYDEVLALAPGILVVGSGASLPFSAEGVRALFEAREAARAAREAEVLPARIALACAGRLPSELRSAVDGPGLERAAGEGGESPGAIGEQGGLFHHFSPDARRALALACRIAHRSHRHAIEPAHLLLACLEIDPGLARRAGLSPDRLRGPLLAPGPAGDAPGPDSGPDSGAVPADPEFTAFVRGLPAGADTLAILEAFLSLGPVEVRQLLQRQRVTPALLERAKGLFADP